MKYCLVLICFVCCAVLSAADKVVFTLTQDRSDALYRCGEKAVFAVHAPGEKEVSYAVKFARRTPQIIQRGTLTLQEGRGEITAALAEPGMLYCQIFAGKGKNAAAGAAFEPEKITGLTDEAADFDTFWAEGKRLQEQCPPITLEKLESESDAEQNSYLMKIPCVDGKVIYGYLSEPAAPGKYPALVRLPGAGPGYFAPEKNLAREGVISLCINIHPYFPGKTAGEAKAMYQKYWGKKVNYLRQNTHDPRLHTYYRAHLAVDRAVTFAASRSNYDGKHFVSYGSSQGGTLGLALAALNPHLTALVAMVPGFGDHAGLLAGRSNSHLLYLNQGDPALLDAGLRTAGYYDSVHFAKRIKVPVLMSVGFVDPTCTPASVWAIYNAIAAPKKMISVVDGTHTVPPHVRQETMDFALRKMGVKK